MQATDNHSESFGYTATFGEEIRKRSDKLMDCFLASFFLGGLLFARYYDTWLIAFGVGGLSLIAYYSAKIALPGSNLYQYVLSLVLGIFMAQYIYQMHGLFEMHFIAFIGSAILITYQNWRLQIPIALFVVVHHALFGYLQNAGFDKIYFTQLDSFELRTFIIHVLFAAVIFFVCGLWAYQLRKYNRKYISQTIEMGRLQKEALIAANEQKQQTERLKSQHELAESNKRFIYASRATSDAIWDRSYLEEKVFWGDGFKTLFGYDINEETRTVEFWKSKVHPDDLCTVNELVDKAKSDPVATTWECEYRFLKADGNYAFVREKAIILRDESGKSARMIGALQDISETKRNEIVLKKLNEDLEKEKYFLDSLMDYMPDSIYFKDRNSKFIRVSKYLAARFNVSIENMIGKSDLDFQDAVHASEAYEDEQKILITKEPKIDYIEKEITEGGQVLWVSTTKLPLIDSHGQVVGTFGISRDVTKVKTLENERHAALLDKAVAQGKFEIASGIMHDIGNAVVGFGSYLTRVRRLQEQEDPENLRNLVLFFSQQRNAFARVIGEAKTDALVKMLNAIAETRINSHTEINKSIIEQLNIITHIQEVLNIQRQYINGHESKERAPVNLRGLVNDSVSMLLVQIENAGIEVSLNVPTDLPVLRGDRTKLVQIMLNIIKNSIEAIEKDAAQKAIAITAQEEPGRLLLQIRDSGKGFDQSTAEQLFKKGFTTKSAGRGFGLYNCRSIIESHDGSIEMCSDGPGKGTITSIIFRM